MTEALKVTVLGCGGSMGVPQIGNYWGACNPDNPKNRRRRNALYVEKGETKILVDCGPDIHEQLNNLPTPPMDITGALITHEHPDHCVGLYELGVFSRRKRGTTDIYTHEECAQRLDRSYPYLFMSKPHYPQQLKANIIKEGRFEIDGITIDAFPMDHGITTTYGFIFDEAVAYCTDVIEIPEFWLNRMRDMNLHTFITECTSFEPGPTHAHLDLAIEWRNYIQPKMTYLTDLRCHMDYDALLRVCPNNVEPAYDGLEINVKL